MTLFKRFCKNQERILRLYLWRPYEYSFGKVSLWVTLSDTESKSSLSWDPKVYSLYIIGRRRPILFPQLISESTKVFLELSTFLNTLHSFSARILLVLNF